MAGTTQDLRQLDRDLFEFAKLWEGATIACKVSGVLLGLVVILLGVLSKIVPFLVIVLALASEFCSWRADHFKGMADSLLVKLDWSDAFGWKISGKEIADLLLKVPARFKQHFSLDIKEQYFTTQEPPGTRRAIENMLESAWWSKNLAHKVAFRYQVATWIMIIASFAVLIISIQTVKDFDQLASIGRAITSFIMCVFSLGVFKLAQKYSGFSKKAAYIEQRAEQLLKTEPTKEDAITLMYDYQISRSAAPLIPTYMYNSMQDELNQLWKKYRKASL